MPKQISSTTAKKIWPAERKLINRVITKQKGYHNKPYPSKNKIPTAALHSVSGALNVLDEAEKKKPNKGHIMKYRREHEHTKALPESHYFAFKKNAPKPKPKPKQARVVKNPPEAKPSALVLQRRAETKEQREARLAASLAKARARFVPPNQMSGPTDLESVIARHLGAAIPKDYFESGGV